MPLCPCRCRECCPGGSHTVSGAVRSRCGPSSGATDPKPTLHAQLTGTSSHRAGEDTLFYMLICMLHNIPSASTPGLQPKISPAGLLQMQLSLQGEGGLLTQERCGPACFVSLFIGSTPICVHTHSVQLFGQLETACSMTACMLCGQHCVTWTPHISVAPSKPEGVFVCHVRLQQLATVSA